MAVASADGEVVTNRRTINNNGVRPVARESNDHVVTDVRTVLKQNFVRPRRADGHIAGCHVKNRYRIGSRAEIGVDCVANSQPATDDNLVRTFTRAENQVVRDLGRTSERNEVRLTVDCGSIQTTDDHVTIFDRHFNLVGSSIAFQNQVTARDSRSQIASQKRSGFQSLHCSVSNARS